MTARTCRWCEKKIKEHPTTGGLRPHKWTREQHEAAWPNLPYLDDQCPGTGSTRRQVTR